MAFFEFQKFSFNHIFFLFYFISSFARQRFKDLLFDKNAKISGTFYTVYIGNISHFLTIIPLLITNYLFKNSKEKNKKGPRSIKYIYYNKIKCNILQVILFLQIFFTVITIFRFQ